MKISSYLFSFPFAGYGFSLALAGRVHQHLLCQRLEERVLLNSEEKGYPSRVKQNSLLQSLAQEGRRVSLPISALGLCLKVGRALTGRLSCGFLGGKSPKGALGRTSRSWEGPKRWGRPRSQGLWVGLAPAPGGRHPLTGPQMPGNPFALP